MCYHCECLLHHICANHVNNNNVHQGLEVISNDKDIHSSLGVAREKVGDLPLNMCSTFQNNSCDSIPKHIVGCYTFTLAGAPKQMGTQIVNGTTKGLAHYNKRVLHPHNNCNPNRIFKQPVPTPKPYE
jgi:hypothetical protein